MAVSSRSVALLQCIIGANPAKIFRTVTCLLHGNKLRRSARPWRWSSAVLGAHGARQKDAACPRNSIRNDGSQ